MNLPHKFLHLAEYRFGPTLTIPWRRIDIIDTSLYRLAYRFDSVRLVVCARERIYY